MKFSEKLQKIRKEHNITQEMLADKLGVSRQAVSKWESDMAYPDTEKLILISKIFNVSLDELINDNSVSSKNNEKKNVKVSITMIFDKVIDFVYKSINMFLAMKFSEKVKCLFEMFVLIIVIIGVSMISSSIIIDVIRRLFSFLPRFLLYLIINILDLILLVSMMILGIIIVIKIFKNRYLDYYVIVEDDSVKERVIEEPIKELKETKYKVVIRDPVDGSLNIFKKLNKMFIWFLKGLCLLVAIPLVILFVMLIVMLIISLFYLFDGLFFNGVSIAIVGGIMLVYLMIEFIYNLFFNMDHMIKRIFVVFIIGLSLVGIGIGVSLYELTTFSYLNDSYDNERVEYIKMSDDLVMYPMIDDMGNVDIIIDNNRDDIMLEIYSYDKINTYIYEYVHYIDMVGYRMVNVSVNSDMMYDYRYLVDCLKRKEIVNNNYSYKMKIYLSSSNLEVLENNINNYLG